MSLNGIGGAYSRPVLTPQPAGASPLRDGGATRTPPGVARPDAPVSAPAARAPLATTSAAAALPAEAPPGTDPALWSVLSADERAFFARSGARGPLTYARAMQTGAPPGRPALRGGRLDIRA